MVEDWLKTKSQESLKVIVLELGPRAIPDIITMMEKTKDQDKRDTLSLLVNPIVNTGVSGLDAKARKAHFNRSEWKSAIRSIGRLLSSEDESLQEEGALWAKWIGPPAEEHALALARLLASRTSKVRKAAWDAMVAVEDFQATVASERIIAGIKRDNTNLAHWAPRILRRTADGRIGVVPEIVLSTNQPAYYADLAMLSSLSKLGEVGTIVELLRDANPANKAAAAYVLSLQPEPARQTVADLTKALADPAIEVVAAAAMALSSAGPQASQAVAALTGIAGSTQSDPVRVAAMVALQAIGAQSSPATGVLEQASKAPNSKDVRDAASAALARIARR